MIRLAFLSTAHIHTRSFIARVAELDGVTVSAVWDDVADRGRRYAESADARFVDALDDALAADDIDGFVITAENTRHLPLLEAAIPVGKPVMCEKPLVTTDADLARLRERIAEHRPVLTNGYFMPHFARFRAAAAALERGDVGDLVLATFRNAHHAAYGRWFDSDDLNWFTDPELAGGGALLDMGTHAVHLLRTICGPVARVWATHANLTGIYPRVDDWGVIELEFASGARGRAEAGWCVNGGHKGLELLGSEAAIVEGGHGLRWAKPGQDSQPLDADATPARPDRIDRLVAAIRGELDARALQADLDAALDAVAIMAAAYRSADTGAWQTLGA